MIPFISALTLMSKIGICIAVFAILIIVEIVALIMLVKWKKNFKPIGTQKDDTDAFAQTKQAEKAETDDLQQPLDGEAVENVDENDTKPLVEAEEDAPVETVEEINEEDDMKKEKFEENLNETADNAQDKVAVEEENAESGDVKKDSKWSAFAFAPLMLLSATSQATPMRYLLYFLIGVAVGLGVAVLGVSLVFAKSFKKAPKQQAQPEQEKAVANTEDVAQPVEEKQPVEEVAPVDESMQEAVEEPVEDIVEDEAEEEELASEEAQESDEEDIQDEIAEEEATVEVVDEAQEEEQLDEVEENNQEQTVEETEDEAVNTAEEEAVEEEQVVEEETPEPVVEEVVEEPKKPEPVKRAPVMGEQTVVVDSKTVLIKDDRFLFNPEEDGWYYVLEKTFTAKLIQSEDIVKDYYTELKNEILSYKKVHQRMRKKRESFNFGRNCLIRMTIRGKTLRIHFALDAKDYEDTKYKVEDTSNVKSLADTPLMYRIKNDRRLKYAKDLIATVMEKFGVEKMPISPLYLNYAEDLPYETTPPLIERGLIIKRRVRGKMPENKGFDFAKKTFKAKLIQADETVKEYYSQLKNHLLSYKKIHDRMSKSRESYRFGRTCVARMSIRGKTLKLYLALDANDYIESKYTIEDASDVKSVADTPLLIKIKNPRRLKHAKELIDQTMDKVGALKRLNADETDYVADIPFEDTEELYDKGLITNVHVDGNSFFAQRIAARKANSEAAADEDDDE